MNKDNIKINFNDIDDIDPTPTYSWLSEHISIRNKRKWKTATGESILLKDLSDDHIINIIKFIKRHKFVFSRHEELIVILEHEIKYRKDL
jgi:hypothetical protein